MANRILIYGGNGYTGKLIIEEAIRQHLDFDIAGRNEASIKEVAGQYKVNYLTFGLDDSDKIAGNIKGYKAVIHAAGPFIHTAKPMMKACIKAKVHYLDITGEIPIFELGAAMGEKAKEANIIIMPGCGFDVVPTDCMASYLKAKLPSATHLQLGFANYGGSVSHGTAMTMLENLGKTGAVRKEGKITPVPNTYKGQYIPFIPTKDRYAMTIPWGDVSTAYYSTGIPNIETFMSTSPKTYKRIKFVDRYFRWVLKSGLVKSYLRSRIKKAPAGPNAQEREDGYVMVWGKVWDAAGNVAEARIKTPEGYKLTAITAVEICKRVINQHTMSGFYTPSLSFGHTLISEVSGALFEDI